MKRLTLIAALLLTLSFLGCQPGVDKTAAATTEKPPAASPRFAALMEAPPQDDQDYPIPSFIVTSFAETRSPEAWVISGAVQQREPVIAGLKFDRLIVIFRTEAGRACEWRTADHSPLEGLVQPVSFDLVLQAESYFDSGFGFEDLADFQANANVSTVAVQIDKARNYIKGDGVYHAGFEAAVVERGTN